MAEQRKPTVPLYIAAETTGTDVEKDEILRINIIDHTGQTVLHSFVRPEHHEEGSWKEAEEINRISYELAMVGKSMDELGPTLRELYQGVDVIVSNSTLAAEIIERKFPDLERKKENVMDNVKPFIGTFDAKSKRFTLNFNDAQERMGMTPAERADTPLKCEAVYRMDQMLRGAKENELEGVRFERAYMKDGVEAKTRYPLEARSMQYHVTHIAQEAQKRQNYAVHGIITSDGKEKDFLLFDEHGLTQGKNWQEFRKEARPIIAEQLVADVRPLPEEVRPQPEPERDSAGEPQTPTEEPTEPTETPVKEETVKEGKEPVKEEKMAENAVESTESAPNGLDAVIDKLIEEKLNSPEVMNMITESVMRNIVETQLRSMTLAEVKELVAVTHPEQETESEQDATRKHMKKVMGADQPKSDAPEKKGPNHEDPDDR